MAPNPLLYQLLLVALVLICLLLHVGLPDDPPHAPTTPLEPRKRQRRRSKEPKPFAGLIHTPLCEACEHGADARPKVPGSPPPEMIFTRGRPRTVDTRSHFCPDPDCSYYGWLGRGNLRANGHPSRQPWRQLQCVSCHGYFYETHGTIFHGKRSSPDLIVRVIACLAEGLGIRGTARVFESDPNTVLQWLVEAADTGDGGGINRPCLVAARGVAVSGAAVATATDGLSHRAGEARSYVADVCSDVSRQCWTRS